MKHNVTPLNGENESLAFAGLMFGNSLLETTLGCYPAWPALTPPDEKLVLLPFPTDGDETYTTHCTNSSSSRNNSSSSSTSTSGGLCTNELWTMYFDGSKK